MINNDGQLDVAYYNPKPIKIAQTKISLEKGKIKIFIELRDTGYPESTYTLDYIPSDDILRNENLITAEIVENELTS